MLNHAQSHDSVPGYADTVPRILLSTLDGRSYQLSRRITAGKFDLVPFRWEEEFTPKPVRTLWRRERFCPCWKSNMIPRLLGAYTSWRHGMKSLSLTLATSLFFSLSGVLSLNLMALSSKRENCRRLGEGKGEYELLTFLIVCSSFDQAQATFLFFIEDVGNPWHLSICLLFSKYF